MEQQPAAGWYLCAPGWQRYWDGTSWSGDPLPVTPVPAPGPLDPAALAAARERRAAQTAALVTATGLLLRAGANRLAAAAQASRARAAERDARAQVIAAQARATTPAQAPVADDDRTFASYFLLGQPTRTQRDEARIRKLTLRDLERREEAARQQRWRR